MQQFLKDIRVPEKPVATIISKALKAGRLKSKAHRSKVKEMRSKKISFD